MFDCNIERMPVYGDWNAFIKQFPQFRYMKAPVDKYHELYQRYTDGLERGTFAFVYEENCFYSWRFDTKTWRRFDSEILDLFNIVDSLNNYAELLNIKHPDKYDAYIILSDETKGNKRTWYAWNGNNWVYLGIYDFDISEIRPYNVTLKVPLKEGFYTLETAIKAVPTSERKPYLVIVFQESEESWVSKRFLHEDIQVFENPIYWHDFGGVNNNEIFYANYADEEDLTADESTKTIKFNDKKYNRSAFSGLGRKYLRKNILSSKNILLQEHVNNPSVIYHIQYDYDLNGKTITIPDNCKILFDGGSLKNGVVNIGNNTIIENGVFEQRERTQWFLRINGDNNEIRNCKIFNPEKSTMEVVPGTGIKYHWGGIGISGENNIIDGCEIYNIEGAGVYDYGKNTTISNNIIRDNCTGILCEKSVDTKITGNVIKYNDVNKTEAYDGILATSNGLIVINNTISFNGEHGTYIQGNNITISNNIVEGNWFNGIKVGNISRCTISNNVLKDNNFSGQTSEGQIFVQRTINNVSIIGNTSIQIDTVGSFIRVWSANANVNDGDVNVCGNTGDGTINIFTHKNITIIGNITNKIIRVGYADSSYPVIYNALVQGNICDELQTPRCREVKVIGNTIGTMSLSDGYSIIQSNNIKTIKYQGGVHKIVGNTISEWDNDRLRIGIFTELSDNEITTTSDVKIMFVQGNAKPNFPIKICRNKITLEGQLLYIDSANLSPDGMVITDNHFSRGNVFTIHGENHFIANNYCDGSDTLCYDGTKNSYYIGNRSKPTFRSGLNANNICIGNLGLVNQVGGGYPNVDQAGLMYFNTSLNKPIWYDGSKWVDASGSSVQV